MIDEVVRHICEKLGATYLHVTQAEANEKLTIIDMLPVVIRSFPSTTTQGKFNGQTSERTAFYFCSSKGDSYSDTEAVVVPEINEAKKLAYRWQRALSNQQGVQAVKFGETLSFKGLLSSNLIGVRVDVTITYNEECNRIITENYDYVVSERKKFIEPE